MSTAGRTILILVCVARTPSSVLMLVKFGNTDEVHRQGVSTSAHFAFRLPANQHSEREPRDGSYLRHRCVGQVIGFPVRQCRVAVGPQQGGLRSESRGEKVELASSSGGGWPDRPGSSSPSAAKVRFPLSPDIHLPARVTV